MKVPFTLASGRIKFARAIFCSTVSRKTHMRNNNLLSFLALRQEIEFNSYLRRRRAAEWRLLC